MNAAARRGLRRISGADAKARGAVLSENLEEVKREILLVPEAASRLLRGMRPSGEPDVEQLKEELWAPYQENAQDDSNGDSLQRLSRRTD